MQQVILEIPGVGLRIYGFGLMLFFAFIGSMQLAARLAKRSKLDPELVYDLAFWLIIGGLIGARGFFVIQYRERLQSFLDVFKIWEGGIVLYGSLIGASVGFLIYWWRKRFPFRALLDVVAPSVVIGVAIGRIGCFLNGCCFGDTCDLPWAVTFPSGSLPWNDQFADGLIASDAVRSLPVHPTQIYSSIGSLLLTGLLMAYYPIRRRDGEVMALLLVTYPINRFLIERLRDDEGAIFGGMTVSQNGSIVLLALGMLFWIYLLRLPTGRHVDSASIVTQLVATSGSKSS